MGKKILKLAKNKLGIKIEEDVQEVYGAGKRKDNRIREDVNLSSSLKGNSPGTSS